MARETNYLEYEEAPSGSVIFYNYKEPLMPFTGGFGFDGALIADEVSGQVQCHFCGGWFEQLGHHLHKEHNMTAGEYKKKVGLNKTTALISEKFREKLIAKGLEARMKNFKKNKYVVTQATRERIRATLKENRMEKRNLSNTCPEQLIERLIALYNKLGRTPTAKYEVGFKEALIRTYGSFKEACHIAGIPYRPSGQTIASKGKYTKEHCVDYVFQFLKKHNRLPESMKDWETTGRVLAIRERHGGIDAICKEALMRNKHYIPVPSRVKYTDQDLLEFLRRFEKIHGRKPSSSDCKRRLLPNASKYIYRFGSWPKALEAAFAPTPLPVLEEVEYA